MFYQIPIFLLINLHNKYFHKGVLKKMETSIEKDFEEVINALLCDIETEREEFIDSNQDLIQRLEKIKK